MKNLKGIAQLLLRLALGFGFILPVLDRMGYFGNPGDSNVAWGDWSNFIAYTNQLMPYIDLSTAFYFGLTATVLELLFGISLISGYKVKYIALGSFVLTLIFALSMMFFIHFRAPFNFSVFVVSFSSLLLSTLPNYPWSIDDYLNKHRVAINKS